MKKILYILAAWCMLVIASCSNTECYDNANSLPLAAFYSTATGKPAGVDSLAIWGLGVPGDSLLLQPQRGSTQTWLPFNLEGTQTSFVIAYRQKALDNPRLNDTITFDYDIQPWFESPECGAIYLYKVRHIAHTSHFIDKVECTAPDGIIDNTPGANIRIYFR